MAGNYLSEIIYLKIHFHTNVSMYRINRIAYIVPPVVLAGCFFGYFDRHRKNDLPLIKDNENGKPNIIFILSDDLSFRDISCYGQKRFSTPNIDRIGKEGIIFSNAYSAQGESAPSRCGLLTGLHMGHATIRANESFRGQEYLNDSDFTIAEMLKDAGYTTGFIGKWGVGIPGSEGEPNRQGFDYTFGFYDQVHAHTYYPTYLYENGKKIEIPENNGYDIKNMYVYGYRKITQLNDFINRYDVDGNYVAEGIADPAKAVNSENLFIRKALNFIYKNKEEPFFLYYATQVPHGPTVTDNLGVFTNKPDYPSLKHKEWASMITRLDNHVGQILDLLEKLNIERNTILIFASDNGYSAWGYFGRKRWEDDEFFRNKGPFYGGKFSIYEGGVRVPLMIKWGDRIKAGQKSDLQIAFWDFLPTLADIAGYKKQFKTDGISFLSALLGKNDIQIKHKFLYWEYFNSQAAIIGNLRVQRIHPDSVCKVYDNINDPYSEMDVAFEHPDIIGEAIRIFRDEHADSKWYQNPGTTDAETLKLKRFILDNNLTIKRDTVF
jgi:arylsulfatase A-like enzyme